MNRILIILFLITCICGCSEIYQPEVESVDPFIVIEGSISTKPGKNYVFINQSRSYNEEPYFIGQTGAQVMISGSNGDEYNFVEDGLGIYSLELAEGNTPEIGSTYTLHVTTAEGDSYVSTPQTIVDCPPIKNLTCSYDQQSILTEDSYGEVYEVNYDGINVIVETDGILPSENYYIYTWKAWEEHLAQITMEGAISTYTLYRHRLLNNKYSNIIHTANADEYYSFQMRDDDIFFIIQQDLTDYDPPIPDSFTLVRNRFEGLIIYLEQRSLSADAYHFYNDVEQQLSAEGRLFDVVLPQLSGNMTCTSDENKKVMGIFYAADVSDQISYLYIGSRNRTSSSLLDSMPELWLDTCSWSMPPGWISPPF